VQQDERERGKGKTGNPSNAGKWNSGKRHRSRNQDVDFGFATAGWWTEPKDAIGGRRVACILEIEKERGSGDEKSFEDFCIYISGGWKYKNVDVLRG
jgi:hypothetical protein